MMHPCQKLAENYVINRLHYLLIWRQIGRHLWYLSEELVGLALFDPKVSLEMKRLMLAAMEDSAPGSSTKATRSEFCCISEQIGFGEILYDKHKTSLFHTWPESISTVFQLFQVLEWSSYLVFRNFHPELMRPKLLPSSCLWRNGVLRIGLRRCVSTLQPQILAVILVQAVLVQL